MASAAAATSGLKFLGNGNGLGNEHLGI